MEYLWNLYSPSMPFALRPSLSGGTNYAIGGATTGTVNYNTDSTSVPPPLQPAYAGLGAQWQLDTFAAQAPLAAMGAEHFLVPNRPEMWRAR